MKDWNFKPTAWKYSKDRMINQIFKLLPLYEEQGEWLDQREYVLRDLYGYKALFSDSPQFMVIIAKLLGLSEDPDMNLTKFRKTIFEIISTIKEVEI